MECKDSIETNSTTSMLRQGKELHNSCSLSITTKLIITQWQNSTILSSLMLRTMLWLISWILVLDGQILQTAVITHVLHQRTSCLILKTPPSEEQNQGGQRKTSRLSLITVSSLHLSLNVSHTPPVTPTSVKVIGLLFSSSRVKTQILWTGQCSQFTSKSKAQTWQTISTL